MFSFICQPQAVLELPVYNCFKVHGYHSPAFSSYHYLLHQINTPTKVSMNTCTSKFYLLGCNSCSTPGVSCVGAGRRQGIASKDRVAWSSIALHCLNLTIPPYTRSLSNVCLRSITLRRESESPILFRVSSTFLCADCRQRGCVIQITPIQALIWQL